LRLIFLILTRIVYGAFFIAAFMTSKDSGYFIAAIVCLFFAGMAFISPIAWDDKVRFSYWKVILLGPFVYVSVLFAEILAR